MFLQGENATVWSSGVDYLTITAKWDNPQLDSLNRLWDSEIDYQIAHGEADSESSPQGYKGGGTKHVWRGQRQDGCMFRASSSVADKMAFDVLALQGVETCTRLDLQVTTHSEEWQPDWLETVRAAVAGHESDNRYLIRKARSYHETKGRGDTFLWGSRRSARYGRIYDKTAEQKGRVESGLLRYELELKRKQSRKVWDILRKRPALDFYALSYVGAEVEALGISAPWTAKTPALSLPSTFEETDSERRARWLIETVAPMLSRIDDDSLKQRFARVAGLWQHRHGME